MVNENQGAVYNPVPFYNRKMVRIILRNKAYEMGYGNVNRRMAFAFKKMRMNKNGEE